MSTRFYGSICITDLFDLVNKKHSAVYKGDNGKIYADTQIWLNDEVDKFGNVLSVQLNPKKDLIEKDGRPYIGNFKEAERKPISSRDTGALSLPDDIAIREKKTAETPDPEPIGEPKSDLPF